MIFLILISINDVVQLYNIGNRYYAENEFLKAIEFYEKALSLCDNKDIHYNLGNAYFKAGNIGKAIIQYRRAYFLSPRDEDIVYNLNFLRNFRPDKVMTIPNPFVQILDRFFHYFSIFESSFLSAFSFLLISIFLSLFLVIRNKIFLWFSILLSLLFIYFLVTFFLWQAEKKSKDVVVVVNELRAYSGPGDEYKEILIIHDGTEAKIREEREAYCLIQLPGGIGGWVKNDGIERIFE